MRCLTIATGFAVLALGAGLSSPAQAVTQARTIRAQGGVACQLSIPTTDTKVRPKAIGFRNEGTINAFTICGYPIPDGYLTAFSMNFESIDGADRSFNCTAANGASFTPPTYSVKTVTTSGGIGSLSWNASDFGGTAGNDFLGYMSVTCILPGQMSIPNVYVSYNEDVGA